MAASAPSTTSKQQRRPRRGSLERPVSARIYRSAWALIALPLLVTAFTVARPEPLPRPALPPSFDAAIAAQIAEGFARDHPDRSPGGQNHDSAATWVADQLRSYNLEVDQVPFTADIPGRGRVRLVDLVARPLRIGPERSPRTIVVMADRDNLGTSSGLDDNASGTGALIELARDLSTLTLAHTVVFVSTDGGSFGGLGAAELAHREDFRSNVLAVVNLDQIAGPGRPRLELAGEGGRSPARALVATADASVLRQTGRRAERPNGFYQLLDLAFPFSLYGQAPLLGHGLSAVTLTAGGDRPVPPATDGGFHLRPVQIARLGTIGRAAQALVGSLDGAGEVASGTGSYIYLGGRLIRGFALQLLLFFALIPIFTATVDLWARLRRRGLELAAALRSYRSRLGVWAFAGGVAALFAVAGAFPTGADRPIAPDTLPAQKWASAALAGFAAVAGLAWLTARVRLVPRGAVERADELAGHLAAMLVLCALSIAVAAVNPYTLLFLLPSLHAWLWVPHARDSAVPTRVVLFAAGLAGPIVLAAVFAVRFGLGFDAPWYLATLFSVGYVPVVLFLTILAWGAAAGQMAAILFGRYAPYPTQGERPERGVIRESVRLTVILLRRLRGTRSPAPRIEEPTRQRDVLPQ